MSDAQTIADALDRAAVESDFSGVVRVDSAAGIVVERAYGLADRAHQVANTPAHRFGTASLSKGFTALAVGALVDDGVLALDTPVRGVLGTDLPLVDDRVTVGHLLSHTSGIGDYLDESAVGSVTDYVMSVPVHTLDSMEGFLPVLDGHAQVSEPGARFAYNNQGFMVAALVAERVSGVPFADLVTDRVFRPAGMTRSGYLRLDELPGDVARGYLHKDGLRTNVLHLPVRGGGDGGAFTTAADLAAFWTTLLDHRIVGAGTLAALTDPCSTDEGEHLRYGHGFWRGYTSELLILGGYDAGVSCRTWHDPATGVTGTVIANWSDGAWPLLGAVDWA